MVQRYAESTASEVEPGRIVQMFEERYLGQHSAKWLAELEAQARKARLNSGDAPKL